MVNYLYDQIYIVSSLDIVCCKQLLIERFSQAHIFFARVEDRNSAKTGSIEKLDIYFYHALYELQGRG